ncbi:MAG: YsnF/AvaK domain-containing protein [Rariglobus sp.]
MKTKSSTVSNAAKLALLAAFAGTASYVIAAESAADTTSRGASTPRNSAGVYTPGTPSRDIGTIEIKADKQQTATTTTVANDNRGERRTITAMNATEIKDDQVVIPLKRESVNVSKRTVTDGTVRLRKVVKTETINQPVELRREMLVLERVPEGSLSATASMPADFEEGEILLPITREEVVINKTVQTDQVLAYVTVESSRQDVNERVRSENIEVVDRGNERVRVIGDISQNTAGPRATDSEANRVAFAR